MLNEADENLTNKYVVSYCMQRYVRFIISASSDKHNLFSTIFKFYFVFIFKFYFVFIGRLSTVSKEHQTSFEIYRRYKIPRGTLSGGAKYRGENSNFRPKSPFISETVRDRPMVTTKQS